MQEDIKESFVFYKSFFEALQDLDDKNRLKMYDAICKLALNNEDTELEGINNTIFKLIKPQVLANTKKYKDGKKGGRPNKKTSGSENKKPEVSENKNHSYEEKKPNENVNENENENENVNEKENENENVNEKEEINQEECLHIADVIYEYYPKHSDYDEVKKWFVEERPSKELANIIYSKIKELKESKQWQKEEGRYIPKLINWLNNKGWLDEVIEEQRR